MQRQFLTRDIVVQLWSSSRAYAAHLKLTAKGIWSCDWSWDWSWDWLYDCGLRLLFRLVHLAPHFSALIGSLKQLRTVTGGTLHLQNLLFSLGSNITPVPSEDTIGLSDCNQTSVKMGRWQYESISPKSCKKNMIYHLFSEGSKTIVCSPLIWRCRLHSNLVE